MQQKRRLIRTLQQGIPMDSFPFHWQGSYRKGGYKRWQHQNNWHRGERTHHGVHVVVDNAWVGVHGGIQECQSRYSSFLVPVTSQYLRLQSGRHPTRQFCKLKLQLSQKVLVATNGCDEVGNRILQTTQSNQTFVVYTFVQVTLSLFNQCTDLLPVVLDTTQQKKGRDGR